MEAYSFAWQYAAPRPNKATCSVSSGAFRKRSVMVRQEARSAHNPSQVNPGAQNSISHVAHTVRNSMEPKIHCQDGTLPTIPLIEHQREGPANKSMLSRSNGSSVRMDPDLASVLKERR